MEESKKQSKNNQEIRQEKMNQNKFWLQNQVNEILEPMMLECCKQNPQNNIDFMIKYLEEKYGEQAKVGDKTRLLIMRQEVSRLESLYLENQKNQQNTNNEDSERGSEDNTDEDNDDDYVEELPMPIKKDKGPRSSISAEAFGTFNKKENFKPIIIPKNDQVKQKIKNTLERSFMFSSLDENEKNIIVDAMQERKIEKKGDVVIKQGDKGDCLYVVESGSLSCMKGLQEPTLLRKYIPGEVFGELALLYNAPRAASIIADNECLLYELDRQTFNHIVKDAAIRKREKYDQFLQKITLLQTVDPYERQQIAEAFRDIKFNSGETIIRQGDEGRELFFLVSGEAIATKIFNLGEQPQEVKKYVTGDYFGEIALLRNEPRQASVIAKTNCSCVTIDRHSFKRMLGPLENILKRNIDLYVQFKAQ